MQAWRIAKTDVERPDAAEVPKQKHTREENKKQKFPLVDPELIEALLEAAQRTGKTQSWLIERSWLMAREHVAKFPGIDDIIASPGEDS